MTASGTEPFLSGWQGCSALGAGSTSLAVEADEGEAVAAGKEDIGSFDSGGAGADTRAPSAKGASSGNNGHSFCSSLFLFLLLGSAAKDTLFIFFLNLEPLALALALPPMGFAFALPPLAFALAFALALADLPFFSGTTKDCHTAATCFLQKFSTDSAKLLGVPAGQLHQGRIHQEHIGVRCCPYHLPPNMSSMLRNGICNHQDDAFPVHATHCCHFVRLPVALDVTRAVLEEELRHDPCLVKT